MLWQMTNTVTKDNWLTEIKILTKNLTKVYCFTCWQEGFFLFKTLDTWQKLVILCYMATRLKALSNCSINNHFIAVFSLSNTWARTCLYIILVKPPFPSLFLFRMVPTILLLVISTALAAPRGNMTEDYMDGSEDNSENSSEGSHDYLEGAHDYMVGRGSRGLQQKA